MPQQTQGNQAMNQQNQQNQTGETVQTTQQPQAGQSQSGAQQIDGQIQQIKQQLPGVSNAQLWQISDQLANLERNILLDKIDDELQSLRESADDVTGTNQAGAGQNQGQ